MLSKLYISKLKEGFLKYASIRRDVIKQSDDALHSAKRAIFALQRGDVTEAQSLLHGVEEALSSVRKKYKNDARVADEGAYKAAVEEYVEAALLYQFIADGKIGEVKGMHVEGESYVAGLCDVPGELYRYAIKAATEKNIPLVKQCAAMAQEIVSELAGFNLTSYLRTKFDQANSAVQKLEQVVYEVSLRENTY